MIRSWFVCIQDSEKGTYKGFILITWGLWGFVGAAVIEALANKPWNNVVSQDLAILLRGTVECLGFSWGPNGGFRK